MRFSEASGRPVVSTSTAVTVGKVDQFLVDAGHRSIAGLRLKKTDGGDTLAWADIASFGSDAVTVSDADKVTDASAELAELSGKQHSVVGKRVLLATGDEIGTVVDVEFNAETGELTALVLAGGDVAGIRLIGVGSYAVVVEAA